MHRDDIDTARILLAGGVDPNITNSHNENTPLHFAAQESNMEMLKLLRNYSASLASRNKYNHTPLHVAVYREKLAAVQYLVEDGAEVDYMAMYFATYEKNLAMMKFLIAKGADPKATDERWGTLLHIAMTPWRGKKDTLVDIITYLLTATNIDINAQIQQSGSNKKAWAWYYKGNTALHAAVTNLFGDTKQIGS